MHPGSTPGGGAGAAPVSCDPLVVAPGSWYRLLQGVETDSFLTYLYGKEEQKNKVLGRRGLRVSQRETPPLPSKLEKNWLFFLRSV